MGQFRRTVKLLKTSAGYIAECFVELKHALTKWEGDRSNVLRFFTNTHIDGESWPGKVAGLVVCLLVAENRRHTRLEIGEG